MCHVIVSAPSLPTQPYTGRYVVAVTGHRELGHVAGFVSTMFDVVLARLVREHGAALVALSGLASGADTLFAEAVMAQRITLDACLPYAQFAESFAPGAERERFATIQRYCRLVHQLPFTARSKDAYMALGYWLVDSCDLLITAWNGRPAVGRGGTGDVVAYARAERRPLIHVHTLEHRVVDESRTNGRLNGSCGDFSSPL